MVTVVLFDPANPDAGYVLEGLKRGSSRVYGSYEEAKHDADKRNAARARYEKLGDVTFDYYDCYGPVVKSSDMPVWDRNIGAPIGGTPVGRGFWKIMYNIAGWDDSTDISLSEVKDILDSDVMVFLKSAAICIPDSSIRSAIAQYFFYVGL